MPRFPRFPLLALALLGTATPALAQREAPAALVAAARAVSREVAGIRDLDWRRPVDFQVSNRPTIQAYARASLEREMSSAQWESYQALLVHVGLIPAGLDLQDLVVRLYAEQIAGYYDPHVQTFYLADWLPPLLQRAVVAHEATHALQDQHFDLDRWLTELSPTEDGALARGAVVEGDAMAVMIAYLLAPTGQTIEQLPDIARLLEGQGTAISAAYPTFERAPEALQRLLLFPYVEGSRFVIETLGVGGWGAVDRLYHDPPASTEQILHPERYWRARDVPRALNVPEGEAGAEILTSGSWGEFGARLVLAAALGDSAAAEPARGWDGDRYALYRLPNGGHRFSWSLAWDTPRDAEEFTRAYTQALVHRFPGTWRIETGQGRFTFRGRGRGAVIVQTGDRVEIRENG
ncbi:MAG: hypothetical protein ABR527_10285 [Gemmatimonadota bacterium]